MKTEALKQALTYYGYNACLGGARRDEEKSRAKERIYSFRNRHFQWDIRQQRPELWNLYNGHINKDESIRIFPLSNWTELDIWQYIKLEKIPIVPLYYAKERDVMEIDGNLIMVDDKRIKKYTTAKIRKEKIRFRTLGCYPLTGAIKSNAEDIDGIIQEMTVSNHSEREGRVIDYDTISMEDKKREGYF